jgi:hypothetical protein
MPPAAKNASPTVPSALTVVSDESPNSSARKGASADSTRKATPMTMEKRAITARRPAHDAGATSTAAPHRPMRRRLSEGVPTRSQLRPATRSASLPRLGPPRRAATRTRATLTVPKHH